MIFIIICFNSCKSQDDNKNRIQTAAKLVEYLKTKDTNSIVHLIGTSDLKGAGKTISFIYDECKLISEYFSRYGYPSIKSFQLKEFPNNMFDNSIVTIPIFKGRDTTNNLLEAYIEVSFAPPSIIPYNKIKTYRIISNYDNKRFKIVPAINGQ